ncbi:MAG: UDP-N-acetylglucosamine 2-epimerase [Nitrospirota bacterium]
MVKRKICIFSGTRAEYGLLRPLMHEINRDEGLQLQIIVSGMHLAPEFGLTYKEIEADGFQINKKVEILLSSDTSVGLAKSVGLGLISFSETLEELKPDIVVVLGDRFEALAAATAALICRVPLAHLHGGEATFGLIDEAIRHSVTKMSHLHFTSTEEYRRRVIQLGEQPERVFAVGAIGLDTVKKLRFLSKAELKRQYGIKFNKHNVLVTFHPVTLENNTSEVQFKALLRALDVQKDTTIIFTKANADMGGRIINRLIDEYVATRPEKSFAFCSLGQRGYLSTMRCVDAVVGNSSSGILEAPSLGVGTINIGRRQEGRIRATSVIDCEPTTSAIKKAIGHLYSDEFQKHLRTVQNPYGDGNTALRIKDILKKHDIKSMGKKIFFDLPGYGTKGRAI